METEMEGKGSRDPRLLGVALALVGGSLVALGTMATLTGLPVPGGNVYSTRGQDIILMYVAGFMFILAAIPNLRRDAGRAQKP